MNSTNKKLIKEKVAAVGKSMEGRMAYSPMHPSGRNPYAHLWGSIKKEYGASYSELNDVFVTDILKHIEAEAIRTRDTTGPFWRLDAAEQSNLSEGSKALTQKPPQIFRVQLKDPDGFEEAFDDMTFPEFANLDEDERETLKEIRMNKAREALAKFVTYGEYVTLEFDIANGTARVVPRS